MAAPPGGGSDPPGDPRFTVAAVARRLGVAPATLRTWDRRYGLGPTGHAFGAHRRYTRADVARLLHMRQLVLDGVAPADAARIARDGQVSTAGAAAPAPQGDRPGGPPGGSGTPPEAPAGAPAPRVGGHGGGRALRLPGAGSQVRGLARAALGMDGATMASVVRAAVRADGTTRTWHDLLAPVLTAVGERWAATGTGVEVEHLLSDTALVAFREVRAVARTTGEDRVLLACAADEQHALPVHVLAAALAERGIGCRVLGAAVPPDALAAAVRRVRPLVVFCWSSMRSTGDPGYLDAVPALVPSVSVVVGGPGWPVGLLGPKVDVAIDVPSAVTAVAAGLGR